MGLTQIPRWREAGEKAELSTSLTLLLKGEWTEFINWTLGLSNVQPAIVDYQTLVI